MKYFGWLFLTVGLLSTIFVYQNCGKAQFSSSGNGPLSSLGSGTNGSMVGLDTDNDGLPDTKEAELGTDPKNPDTDDDGLTDGQEVNTHHTNPLDPDTDHGGVKDGAEVSRGTDPLDPKDDMPVDPNIDTDKDGLTDTKEKEIGTDPKNPDTDDDGLTDGQEVNTHHTNPLDPDTDHGGVKDGAEVSRGSDPLEPKDDLPGAWGDWSNVGSCEAGKQRQVHSRVVCVQAESADPKNADVVVKHLVCSEEQEERFISCMGGGSSGSQTTGGSSTGSTSGETSGGTSSATGGGSVSGGISGGTTSSGSSSGGSSAGSSSGGMSSGGSTGAEVCPQVSQPVCKENEKMITEKDSRGCSVSHCVIDPNFNAWVNSQKGETHEQTCRRVGRVPSEDRGLGICASGEDRPEGVSSIKYIYGTWGSNPKGGTVVFEEFCYQNSQKRDHDKTDLTVAYLCKEGVPSEELGSNRWCHMSDERGKRILGYRDNGAVHKKGCWYNPTHTFYSPGSVLKHDGHYIRCDSGAEKEFPLNNNRCKASPKVDHGDRDHSDHSDHFSSSRPLGEVSKEVKSKESKSKESKSKDSKSKESKSSSSKKK